MRIIQIGFVVVLVAAGVIGFVFRDKLTGAAQDLSVGDCFDSPTVETVEEVQHHPCNEPHDAEVFVVRDYEGTDTFPGLAAFETWVGANCMGSEFTAYVGDTFESREDVGVGYLYPTEDGWGNGDHEMVCYLSPVDGSKISTSYRKAGN